MKLNDIINEYKPFLHTTPRVFFSPGRVNLIGEHIDYLGGRVFPAAIDLGTYAFVTPRDDQEFHFLSHNYADYGEKIIPIHDLEFNENRYWANYAVGMIEAFVKKGLKLEHGLNVLIYGTLPSGAGLSSSASLEVLMGVVLETMYTFPINRVELVKMAQEVENNYIGVNCGIMDQFAVGMGKEGHAIYLDTTQLEYEYVPLNLTDDYIVIANTNKKRALADSKYNERRNECDSALAIIQEKHPSIEDLCSVPLDVLPDIELELSKDVLRKRVKHAVTENVRTKKAVQVLQQNDLTQFGLLVNESHQSLQMDFEVSCHELDVMAKAFQQFGAKGARMTGAGFGGCVVAIVPKNKITSVLENVKKDYISQTKYQPDFYICNTSDGTRELTKEEWK